MIKLNIAGIVRESVVDGPGIRLVIFTQGCPRRCRGCHNPELIPPAAGRELAPPEVLELIRHNVTPLTSGLTFSGGDPLMQDRAMDEVLSLVRAEFPRLNIWVYTGYLYEEVKHLPVLRHVDVLVDGPYIEARRDPSLPFRGSANQRVIELSRT